MDWFWMPVIVCAIIFLALVIGGAGRITDEGPKEKDPPKFLGDLW